MPELDDKVVEDNKEVKPSIAPTLDQVHAISKSNLENEDDSEEVAAVVDEEEQEEVGETGADADEETVPDAPNGNETEETEEKPTKPAVELDIEKPGDGKVAIKDSEGKTFYFNNLDEVPSTFEPASYKDLMVGTRSLMKKEAADEVAAEQATKDAEKAEHVKQTEAMQKNWDKDSDALVKAGLFPKEGAKLEKAKEQVYDYMEAELKNGNVITSFNQAYKSMMYDKQQADNAKKQKELDDAKKKRGGIVQGGSGGGDSSAPTKSGKTIEAPRAGTSLDAIHNHVLSNL